MTTLFMDTAKMTDESVVAIIDDDDALRDALAELLEAVGFQTKGFHSAESFIETLPVWRAGCALVDVRLPGMDGIALLKQIAETAPGFPVIVITGHGDVPMAVDALKTGAVDFIEKPFDPDRVLDSVKQALGRSAEVRRDQIQSEELQARLELLTPREREVMDHMVIGHSNKVIAARLGISPRTVEIHRSRVMEKMAVDTLAELVRQTLSHKK
ncbi:Transcriptional regulatory protein FixJ [Azospirillaceae bacterium]